MHSKNKQHTALILQLSEPGAPDRQRCCISLVVWGVKKEFKLKHRLSAPPQHANNNTDNTDNRVSTRLHAGGAGLEGVSPFIVFKNCVTFSHKMLS